VEDRKPGLLKVTEWALQRRLSPRVRGYIEQTKAANEAFKKAMPKEYPIASGLADNKEANDLKVFLRGDPYVFGEDAPRGFEHFLGRAAEAIHQGQRPPGAGRRDFETADRNAGDGQSHLEMEHGDRSGGDSE